MWLNIYLETMFSTELFNTLPLHDCKETRKPKMLSLQGQQLLLGKASIDAFLLSTKFLL